MVRACEYCAMWDEITNHGKARTTGYCSHPLVGRVTNGSDHCPFYVRGNTRGPSFDVGSAIDAYVDRDKHRARVAGRRVVGPAPVPLDVLRARRR